METASDGAPAPAAHGESACAMGAVRPTTARARMPLRTFMGPPERAATNRDEPQLRPSVRMFLHVACRTGVCNRARALPPEQHSEPGRERRAGLYLERA